MPHDQTSLTTLGFFLAAGIFSLAGCTRREARPEEEKPVGVVVSPAVTRKIVDHEDFTGRLEAYERVDVYARVTGYLQKVKFTEGVEVKKDKLLFEIDPTSYQAEYDKTVAQVNEANVKVKQLKPTFDRYKVLRGMNSIGREEFEKVAAEYNEALAAVDVAMASQKLAKTNLDWTKVTSPINGVTSRTMIDPGNLVKADATVLTTIVSLDPIYAYFDVDERTDLRLERLVREGKIKSIRNLKEPGEAKDASSDVVVLLALADEEEFKDHVGVINFVENRLEPTTGTKRYRAKFCNPDGLLTPGQFVRIRFPIGAAHTAIVIPEQAINSDQGQKFVYVVNADNEVVYRKIRAGQQLKSYRVVEPVQYKLRKDGQPELDAKGRKIIFDGLEEGERVIVSGLQRVRPGIKVTPQMQEIPPDAAASNLPAAWQQHATAHHGPAAPPNKIAAP